MGKKKGSTYKIINKFLGGYKEMEKYFDRLEKEPLIAERWKKIEELESYGIKPFGKKYDR